MAVKQDIYQKTNDIKYKINLQKSFKHMLKKFDADIEQKVLAETLK